MLKPTISIIETFCNVAHTAKADIVSDPFSNRYVIEKFDGRSERTGEYLFVKRSFAATMQDAREAANNWIEDRI